MTTKHKKQTLKIIESDFREAGVYSDCRNCLLATAAKRKGFTGVNCGPSSLTTREGYFTLSHKDENKIFHSYPSHPDSSVEDIDGCAQPRSDAKPFSVTLIPIV